MTKKKKKNPTQSNKQQNPTNALNTVESFIGIMQIPEDLTHGLVSQQLQLKLKVPQCKQNTDKIQSNVPLVFKRFLHIC